MTPGSDPYGRRDRAAGHASALRGGWRRKDLDFPSAVTTGVSGRRWREGASGGRAGSGVGVAGASATYPPASVLSSAPLLPVADPRKEALHAAGSNTHAFGGGVGSESRLSRRLSAAKQDAHRYCNNTGFAGSLPATTASQQTGFATTPPDSSSTSSSSSSAAATAAATAAAAAASATHRTPLRAASFGSSFSTSTSAGPVHAARTGAPHRPSPPLSSPPLSGNAGTAAAAGVPAAAAAAPFSPTAEAAAAGSGVSGGKKLCCDKCDAAHATDQCPFYPKPRENHPDALRRKPPEMGRPCGDVVVRRAQVVRQPGDGSCLFHSLCHGLGAAVTAGGLRRQICGWVRENPDTKIADTPMSDWILWDSNRTPSSYASTMSVAGWGGGIEIAACARLKSVNIHVWEQNRSGPGYRRISCFDAPRVSAKTINVLYQGGVHYDALVL